MQELQEIDEETDINRDWQNLKQINLEAAKEFKLAKDGKNANHWWDDDCKRAIKEKNEIRKKCLTTRKTRANLDLYHQKRTQANRICRKKKKEWLEGKIKQVNEIKRKRESRKFYKDVRNLSTRPTEMMLICKDKEGNLLSERKQILERWQQYFKELLNTGNAKMGNKEIYERVENNLELEEPTYNEINKIKV